MASVIGGDVSQPELKHQDQVASSEIYGIWRHLSVKFEAYVFVELSELLKEGIQF
jgi:hypothetical protein